MLAIVGKASPCKQTGEIEYFLSDFRQMLRQQGQFVYGWSFNPDARALAHMRRSLALPNNVFLYLPADRGQSSLRMQIVDFPPPPHSSWYLPPSLGTVLHCKICRDGHSVSGFSWIRSTTSPSLSISAGHLHPCSVTNTRLGVRITSRFFNSYRIMQKKVEGLNHHLPVPDHDALRIGTLQSIIRQSGLPRVLFAE